MTIADCSALPERIEEKIVPEPITGCWLWTAYRDPKGYGRLQAEGGGRVNLAHRDVYERLVGPIPEGLTLDHLCKTPSCVNPAHLEPVTGAENTRRGRAGEVRRAIRRAVTQCKNGHEYLPETTYVVENLVTGGTERRCRICLRASFKKYRAKRPRRERLPKTHCGKGHELTPENTIAAVSRGKHYRACRACKLESRRQKYRATNE